MAMFGKRKSATKTAPQANTGFGSPAANTSSIARAVLVPAVSTMISDGDISDFELAQLSNLCSFSPIFMPMESDHLHHMIKDIISEIARNGHPEAIKNAATMLTPALCETALCFAVRVALADGFIDENEKNSLSQTGYFMNIAENDFARIVDVVAMMQRPIAA